MAERVGRKGALRCIGSCPFGFGMTRVGRPRFGGVVVGVLAGGGYDGRKKGRCRRRRREVLKEVHSQIIDSA